MSRAERAVVDDARRAGLDAAFQASRIVIEDVAPSVDGGRHPARAVIGQTIEVSANIFVDGAESLGAELRWRSPDGAPGAGASPGGERVIPMTSAGNDRWTAHVTPAVPGLHRFTIVAWCDEWRSYRERLSRFLAGGDTPPEELEEGVRYVGAAALRAPAAHAPALQALAQRLAGLSDRALAAALLDPQTHALIETLDERSFLTRLGEERLVDVERVAAGFASWYELFPRSQAPPGAGHGRLEDVISRLPDIRGMGFDVVYLTPIHPIGRRHRKGRNNSQPADADDLGSPYAIGAAEGGHEAIHPALGSVADFRRLVEVAAQQGLEVALDLAIQCSRDHPWLSAHPEWFAWRPDGSIRYAQNPPKRYEDIVNVDFYANGARPALWLALRDIVLHWVQLGVRTFRVDNPHTKPFPFWTWLIADVRARHPDVIFLSEAFTRPALMYRLAKIGFSQSYTYFTWRNTKRDLTDYFEELTQREPRYFFRPHLFVNTPDINPFFLQTAGRPGFLIRAALAATLSGLWGVYSGFELCEATPLPGREEYLDSEKYEVRARDWNAPGHIKAEIARLNAVRRENPALHSHLSLAFHAASNEQVIWYGKSTVARDNVILVAVSLDPHHVQETFLEVPLWEFGLPDSGSLAVEELMRGTRFTWHGKRQHWRFIPQELPFAIFRVQRAAG